MPLFASGGEDKCANLREVISEKRYQLSLSVSEEVQERVEEAKRLLTGKYPKGVSLEDLLSEAVEALLVTDLPLSSCNHLTSLSLASGYKHQPAVTY